VDVGSFKALSQHLPGGTERNHEKPQSEYPTVWTRSKPKTFRIRKWRATQSTSMWSCTMKVAFFWVRKSLKFFLMMKQMDRTEAIVLQIVRTVTYLYSTVYRKWMGAQEINNYTTFCYSVYSIKQYNNLSLDDAEVAEHSAICWKRPYIFMLLFQNNKNSSTSKQKHELPATLHLQEKQTVHQVAFRKEVNVGFYKITRKIRVSVQKFPYHQSFYDNRYLRSDD
jgi:hypothetical protein